MKLVDENLKKIFEDANITDIIKAYGYMRNSGCYTRAESMSNALYYFDKKTTNEYDLIIHREYRDSPNCVEFYKLADIPHLKDYITYCLSNKHVSDISNSIHDDAYDLVIEIETNNPEDIAYLLSDYQGVTIRRIESMYKHQVIDGVIYGEDGGEVMMAEEGEYTLDDEYVDEMPVGNMAEGGNYAEIVGRAAEPVLVGDMEWGLDEMVKAEEPTDGEMIIGATDNQYTFTRDGEFVVNDNLYQLIASNQLQRSAFNELGDDVDMNDIHNRFNELVDNLGTLQRILENR